jgi:PTS system glucitol/sorbitol-specific IIA component
VTPVVKYQAKITQIGPLVGEFTAAGVLVLFGEDAPEELKEFSIIHDGKLLHKEVAPGDWFCLEDGKYRILAVGEVANTNLGNLGHLILKFNGIDTPEMPGDVCVEAKPLPDIEEGMSFSIVSE